MTNSNNLDYLKKYQDQIEWDQLLEFSVEQNQKYMHTSNARYHQIINEAKGISEHHFEEKENGELYFGSKEKTSEQAIELCRKLIPWKKGPFNFFGENLDAEWRSDYKWERIQKYLPTLKNKKILDIGCNNGYFMFKMAKHNPNFVLGIDPVAHYHTQFNFLQNFSKIPNLHHELWGVDQVKHFNSIFDVVFSMGIIYHHRNPIAQLLDIKNSLKPGGTIILETIGIPGDGPYALFPEDRYAKMRNIWFIPTVNCLVNWLKKSRFIDIEVISQSELTFEEQRLTDWCPPPHQSLEDFLDPADNKKTIEGFEAPIRFCLKAKKRLGY